MERTSESPIIRITRDEALGSHAADLLKRQMSLRGESGVTRDRGRRWYYQNWFVFMIAGGLAAFAAWAALEPFFNDLQYLQGKIEAVDLTVGVQDKVPAGDEQVIELRVPVQGVVTLKGERLWFLRGTKIKGADGEWTPLDPASLKPGAEVGIYVDYEAEHGGLVFTRFVVPAPPPQSPAAASLTLKQLQARTHAAGFLLFAAAGGLIGLAIGAADGIVCRLPRRALLGGGVGLLVGFVGGFLSNIFASLVYQPLTHLAVQQAGDEVGSLSGFGFFVQMVGRAFAWMLAGMAMGLGQGIALRSKQLLLYGFLGGLIGGLLGGLLFDPIDMLLLGVDKPSAHYSRMIGITVVGMSVGGMMGLVELLARDAWLRMTEGPLAGKEFLLFKDLVNVGSSPRADIYLFNDPLVKDVHASIRSVGEESEIENLVRDPPALLNGRPFQRGRLRHGDQVTIGRTSFVFQKRQR
ncbi:MAG TPA: FHA domain-containing protein [Pirellulales bacterium]